MSHPEVRLRRLQPTDVEAVHSWAGLPEVCRYQAWGPNSLTQTREFVAEAVAAWHEGPQTRFAYAALYDDEVIGMGEFHIRSLQHAQGEIQYVTHPRVWGHGLGTAIGRQLLRIGFHQLRMHRIYATCDPRNAASAAILKKLGMAHEGHLRHTAKLRDGWRDSALFSILDSEWTDGHNSHPAPSGNSVSGEGAPAPG
ncbi:RimJ/RimL family protein N-acetyltransferase [Nonomuraea polychroma]|uniref:RimJ/RimL family protein N-acetyltransferase n=1 Tax=Nonomuraea polychroma TaxID=46176 RepID=A0A438MM85_9ACTN|nr:GNAT family protein [Nonomuraea polychroma]RVX46882.1 RimJ/RimL family protein N-acetyltransferase [Nonomuraea polychroma]